MIKNILLFVLSYILSVTEYVTLGKEFFAMVAQILICIVTLISIFKILKNKTHDKIN